MSERHSVSILNLLREYDSFLDSLKTIVDMGCGTGEDITWWATLETRDDPPEPYNYNCFAVDRDASKLAKIPDLVNIHKMHRDFNDICVPVKADLVFAHDCLQYSTDPIATLRNWNELMNLNAMLILSVPQHSGVQDNKYYSRSYSGCYYHYTPVNLIYMLAVNGFDCRDAYMLKRFNDPWVNIAVYKSDVKPMDHKTTTWYDLVDTGLLNPTVVNSVNKFGYLRQEDVLYPWLDKENYYIDYVSTWTEIPEEAGDPKIDGIFNKTTASTKENTIKQAKQTKVETRLLKPVGVRRPPKKYKKEDD